MTRTSHRRTLKSADMTHRQDTAGRSRAGTQQEQGGAGPVHLLCGYCAVYTGYCAGTYTHPGYTGLPPPATLPVHGLLPSFLARGLVPVSLPRPWLFASPWDLEWASTVGLREGGRPSRGAPGGKGVGVTCSEMMDGQGAIHLRTVTPTPHASQEPDTASYDLTITAARV